MLEGWVTGKFENVQENKKKRIEGLVALSIACEHRSKTPGRV